jgi:hypothetical protein
MFENPSDGIPVEAIVLLPLEDAVRFPYPLRAMRISLELMPFGIWLKPQFVYRRHLGEQTLQSGERLWWFRWLWLQVSYSRWN